MIEYCPDNMALKTSEEWQKKCKITIKDPDGWDRKNFNFSWFEEKITKEEFERRTMCSTCEFPNNLDFKDIWNQ